VRGNNRLIRERRTRRTAAEPFAMFAPLVVV